MINLQRFLFSIQKLLWCYLDKLDSFKPRNFLPVVPQSLLTIKTFRLTYLF